MNNKHTTRPVDPPTTYSHEFWANYVIFLVKQGVYKRHVEWYVFRTKQYIALFPEQHIRSHSPAQVEQYQTLTNRTTPLQNPPHYDSLY